MVDSLMRIMLSEGVMLALIFIPAILLLALGYALVVRPLREENRPEPDTEQPGAPKAARARSRGKKSPFNSRLTGE
ncbi:MAG: hypothetical protein ACRDZO_28365 [Egibacteraceae bacterium]